jgi:hypothetical protein
VSAPAIINLFSMTCLATGRHGSNRPILPPLNLTSFIIIIYLISEAFVLIWALEAIRSGWRATGIFDASWRKWSTGTRKAGSG